jgi:hypothetical protein
MWYSTDYRYKPQGEGDKPTPETKKKFLKISDLFV